MATDLKELTASVVAAFVENNSVGAADLPSLIRGVHAALAGVDAPDAEPEPETAKRITPGAIRKSITPEALICFGCGQGFKTLRRHILASHGQTPSAYIADHGLPLDYPMVSEATSKMRSDFAKSIGLGRQAAPEPAPPVKAKAVRKPRPPKAIDPAEETFT